MPGKSTDRAGAQHERRDIAQGDRPRAAVGDLDAHRNQPRRRVEPNRRQRLSHLDHAGLDEHGRDADRSVAAHRQAAGHLDEQHTEVGVGACRGLQDRARHRAVAARLAHQQQPQVVAVCLEPQLALEHRRARQRRHAAGDDARWHALRVRVDRREVASCAHRVQAEVGPVNDTLCSFARTIPSVRSSVSGRRSRVPNGAEASPGRRSLHCPHRQILASSGIAARAEPRSVVVQLSAIGTVSARFEQRRDQKGRVP